MAVIQMEKLPHNDEAEKAVLGAMLRSKTILSDAVSALDEEDFYELNANHRAIFKAMRALSNAGKPVDAQTVVNELINNKDLEVAGGPEYLLELADSVITFSNIPTYIENIKEQSILRKFLQTLDEIQLSYLKQEVDANFLPTAEKMITDVTKTRNVGEFRSAARITETLKKELENLKYTNDDSAVTGVPTGYPKLNAITHGFQKGNYIVLAARPGIGKTALALNLAYNAARRGETVAYFSLEMRAEDLFKRIISGDSNVKYNTLQTGLDLKREDRLKIQQSCESLSGLKMYVEDTSGISITDLMAKVRKLKNDEKTEGLSLVIVDYIGLVATTGKRKSDSRTLEIQEISTSLKKLALELKISIIAVAQLNRKVEERGGEPMLSDLRESGSLEQDADIVMLMHEPKIEKGKGFGHRGDESAAETINSVLDTLAQKDGGSNAKIVNVKIAKNRSGQQGNVTLIFRRDYQKFDSPSKEFETQYADIESARNELTRSE